MSMINDEGDSTEGSGAAGWLRRACDWKPRGRIGIDFQMHTRWSDGNSTVAEMIRSANEKGLSAIALTEHVNSQSFWYRDFVSEVEMLRAAGTITTVYHGAEIAVRDYQGGLKVEPSILEAEYILGVVHRYPRAEGGFWDFNQLTAQDGVELELKALEGLAANSEINAIGHPGGTAFKKFGPFPVEWLEPAFRTATENGVAIELNSKYLWDFPAWCALLWRVNPILAFGSDAHHARELGVDFSRYLESEVTQGGSN